jgi:hypothetical protein
VCQATRQAASLSLQRLGAFDFSGAESLDLLRIDVMRNLDDYFYMEEQDISLRKAVRQNPLKNAPP